MRSCAVEGIWDWEDANGKVRACIKNLHRRPWGSLGEHALPYWMDLCARITLSSQKGQEPRASCEAPGGPNDPGGIFGC